jgi:hypothetical protein
MKRIEDVLNKTTLTISCPINLFLWLKETQRNCSAYVVAAVQEKKTRDEQAGGSLLGHSSNE